jgi:hypothetical protein
MAGSGPERRLPQFDSVAGRNDFNLEEALKNTSGSEK